MKKIKSVHFVLFFILVLFILLILNKCYPIEGFYVTTTPPPSTSADIESNILVRSSPNQQQRRQYVIDNVDQTFIQNEMDLLIRSKKHEPSTPAPIATSPPLKPSQNPNLNFSNGMDGWNVIYFPESIIGPNGIKGPNGISFKPNIEVKDSSDSYGFTFNHHYLQVEFKEYYKYKFHQNPFISIQTAILLNPGYYKLNYNIQTSPNYPIEKDKRTIAIMATINNTYANTPFLFSKKDADDNQIASLTDETKLTKQSMDFYISKLDAMNPIVLSFIFIVTDPKITDNCTVAIGDIEILNCQYNSC